MIKKICKVRLEPKWFHLLTSQRNIIPCEIILDDYTPPEST